MPALYRHNLRTKLLAGFAGVGLLIGAMLVFGHHFMKEYTQHMEQSLSAEVRPLAQMNQLQARLHRVRVLEVELPRLTDYFAVTTHLELLRSEERAFSSELETFLHDSAPAGDAIAVNEAWAAYRADLTQIAQHAAAMDMKQVEMASAFESAVPFKQVSRALQDISASIEEHARTAREQMRRHHEQQRLVFGLISVIGLALTALGFTLFARSVARRVHVLRDAAQRISDGESKADITLPGNDELSDLGHAFNVMRKKVEDRERDLRIAYAGQEMRVLERTRELDESNKQLQREIDERKRAEHQLRLLSQAIEQSPVSVLITDVECNIEYANEAFVQSTGCQRDEVMGKTPRALQPERMPEEIYLEVCETVQKGQAWCGEFSGRREDGSAHWEHDSISPVSDADGRISHFVMIREDVTLRKQQEEKILFQAQYDHLTKLPNRLLAMDRLSQAIVAAGRNGKHVALMFLDLDDFKKVNDSLGHDAGDALLVEAAHRLREAVRASDTVARQGGDEFLVIMSDLDEATDAERVASKIVAAFSEQFALGDSDVVVSPSIGMAVYPDDGDTASDLLRNADLAMYDAKESGGSTYRFFNKAIHAHSAQRLALEHDLRHALADGELRLYYQPQVATRERRVIGAEALLRWESPIHGMVPPDRFIGLAEQTHLIIDIGHWLLRTACMQAAQWRRDGYEDFFIAVNVSPRQFRGSSFLDHVREALAESGLPARNLQIEVTEGLLIRNAPEVNQILHTLDEMGIGIALDDFGTGYASLSYLKRFPFNSLKIDREFIRDIAHDRDDRVLVTAAIKMGKALGLSIVAEGVETPEQLDFLAAQDCDIVQGYFFGRAVPAAEFAESWLMPLPNPILHASRLSGPTAPPSRPN